MSWAGYLAAAVFLVIAIIWYFDSLPEERHHQLIRMAEDAAARREEFSKQDKSAFVVGYTGEVGKELVRELLRPPRPFSKLVLIGRREVEYQDEAYKDVEQKVVDFDKLKDYEEVFRGHDAGFICLGTTRGKAGATGFHKVDHDYVMSTAKLAKDGGVSQLHVVSSQGANKNSSFLYQKTKGEVEEELQALSFDRLVIYRPAVLMCKREEFRFGESVVRTLLKPVAAAFPTAATTPTSTCAKAMVNSAVTASNEKVEILQNKAIHLLSGDLK